MYKSVTLKVLDNKLIRGCVRTPEGEGPFPTVCFYHGFSVDKVGLMRLHELFARECVKAGFACVRFDFYGCGESDGDFVEMRASDEIEEAIAIYHWTQQQNFADPESVFPVGHSLGGMISSIIAPILQPKGAVMWSPGLSGYYDISSRVGAIPGHYEKSYDVGGLELAGDFLVDLRKIDIPARSKGYDKGVLLIHGELDEKIPVSTVGPYLDIYGDNIQLHIIKGANHQFNSLKWKEEVYNLTIEYLKKKAGK